MTKNKLILMFIIGVIALSSFLFIPVLFPDKITPSVLRVGVLPDENREVLRKRYAPLLKYLSETIGIDTQLILPSDYQGLSQLFQDGEIELAYFGGFTFVQASLNSDAEALVMRDIDTRFVSYFLARPTEDKKRLSDFEGMRFSFGSQLSTSGHLMPRHFMKSELQIEPEKFFSAVDYSGSHDKTAFLVRDGNADLGVANSAIIREMTADGRLSDNELQIVWETPPYVDYVWAVQKNLDETIKNNLRDAFLGLDPSKLNHKTILTSIGAGSFLPAGNRDFQSLKVTAKNLGMLEASSK
jgi:phosphonate transport system substrate-binding protein